MLSAITQIDAKRGAYAVAFAAAVILGPIVAVSGHCNSNAWSFGVGFFWMLLMLVFGFSLVLPAVALMATAAYVLSTDLSRSARWILAFLLPGSLFIVLIIDGGRTLCIAP